MNQYEELIEALTIFNKYDHNWKFVSAEHDQIFAGPDVGIVSPEDITRLSALGWHASEDSGFSKFV